MFPAGAPAFLIFLSLSHIAQAAQIAASAAAAQFGLATSTVLPFPTSTQSSTDAQNLLVSQMGAEQGAHPGRPREYRLHRGPVPQTSPRAACRRSNTSGPVMQITYPEGSFSHDTGGVQFYSLWNTTDGSSFNSMMVSYEIAFDAGFDWVKGGKLPGLRGGLNSTGCSGGNKADGLDCFSSRLMWRKNGAGEGALLGCPP